MSRMFRRMLSTLSPKSRTDGPRGPRPRLGVESLEARVVMSGNPLPAGISISAGTVYINCSASNDAAIVSQQGAQIKVALDNTTYIPLLGGGVIPLTTHKETSYATAGVNKLVFYGRGGNDTFTNKTGITSTALGQDGNDTLTGGWGNDMLNGGLGDDVLEGRGGDDKLTGGVGNDRFVFSGTGLGSDTVVEGANADTDTLDFSKFGPIMYQIGNPPPGVMVSLTAPGAQVVKAGTLTLSLSDPTGIEDVQGSAFADAIWGNGRGNCISGNGENDRLYGYSGDDTLCSGDGNDIARGGDGNDVLNGGKGTDRLYGDAANDTLNGDAGNDRLYGGLGNDKLFGADGDDTLVTIDGAANDQANGGVGTDTLWADMGDAITDAPEYVHNIGQFMNYKIANGQGGTTTVAVGRNRTGRTWRSQWPSRMATPSGITATTRCSAPADRS